MAEAYKCDVVDCNQFSEGTPASRFVVDGQSTVKGVCREHTNQIISQYFPSLLSDGNEAPSEAV